MESEEENIELNEYESESLSHALAKIIVGRLIEETVQSMGKTKEEDLSIPVQLNRNIIMSLRHLKNRMHGEARGNAFYNEKVASCFNHFGELISPLKSAE